MAADFVADSEWLDIALEGRPPTYDRLPRSAAKRRSSGPQLAVLATGIAVGVLGWGDNFGFGRNPPTVTNDPAPERFVAQLPAPESSVPDARPASKLAVPNAEARTQAEQRVQDVFKNEVAKAKKPEEKVSLAQTLLTQAADDTMDVADKYVLCGLARELATAAGDSLLACQAVDELVKHFEVEQWDLRAETLVEVSKHLPADANLRQAFLSAALDQSAAALRAEQPDAAAKIGSILQSALSRQKDPAVRKQLQSRLSEIKKVKQQWASVKQAEATLEKDPADIDANLAVGKYLCLLRNDWKHGLPYLARGGDGKLAALARQDAGGSTDAGQIVKLADGWWELSAAETGTTKQAFADRAETRYQEALPQLSGLNKVKVEKRLEQISALRDDTPKVASTTKADAPGKARPAGRGKAFFGAVPKNNLNDLDRFVAERLTATGAGVRIISDNWSREIDNVNPMPAGAFKIYSIDTRGAVPLTDADCEVLAGLQELRNVNLDRSSIGDVGLAQLCKSKSLRVLRVSETLVSDKGLNSLKDAPELVDLNLSKTQVTAAGLAKLTEVKMLLDLTIDGTKLNDASLKPIAQLGSLRSLSMQNLKISDAALANLSGMQKLVTLHVSGCPITLDGFRQVGELPTLMLVYADNTRCSDEGVKHLVTAAPRLQLLSVSDTAVSNQGLKHLASLKTLRQLHLVHTQVGPGGLAALKEHSSLNTLRLSENRFSQEELQSLRTALPKCQIYFSK